MTEPPTPQTFVLVHGAWHGGWCWRRVADRLHQAGHRVYTPTLTGLADRSHLMSRMITLETHITDILNLFRWEQLENVILCGHSYAGWVISGVADKLPEKISALVYLDAHLPEHGETGVQLSNNAKRIIIANERGETSTRPRTAAYFKVNKRDRSWVNKLLTPQPIGVSFQPLLLTGGRDRIKTKVYIRAAGFTSKPFNRALGRAKRKKWRTHTLPYGHDVMIDEPERLTRLLLDIARS